MTILGKYTLHQSLGRGGYGTVYLADETILKVQRAVKLLHPVLVADPSFIERFRHEAQVAARLEHPHIVPVYELSEDQGRYYLAMKYMPGGSLKDLLEKEGRLSYERALQITWQVASALDFAHQQGLVHRDVKPGNILFEKDGTARLADFGFSKAMHGASSASLSATGGMIGTPQYMAPELWSGKSATSATDVYSLACVLCEMLSGEVLFAGDSPAEIMKRHVLDGPQLPKEWPSGVPDGFEGVLRKALAMHVDERYSTTEEFFEELEKLHKTRFDPYQVVRDKNTDSPTYPILTVKLQEAKTTQPSGFSSTPKAEFDPAKAEQPAHAEVSTRNSPVSAGSHSENPHSGATINKPMKSPQTSLPVKEKEKKLGAKPNFTLWSSLGLIGALLLMVIILLVNGTQNNVNAIPQSVTRVIITKVVTSTFSYPTSTPKPAPPASASSEDTWSSPIDGMLLAYIPAGDFQMGNADGSEDEKPVHLVNLDSFWMDVTEITNFQYAKCVAAGSCEKPYNASLTRSNYYSASQYRDYPVITVSWDDANNYCSWAGRRLPTEAEWEKAARGGLEGELYPWGDDEPICEFSAYNGAHTNDCISDDTVRVGSYQSNSYGLFDMVGNVGEWVMDWYGISYYSVPDYINPQGPKDGRYRVMRDGLNVASRSAILPSSRNVMIGFRCAYSP